MADQLTLSHGTRVILGMVWMWLILMCAYTAWEYGFGPLKSTAIGIVAPPVGIVATIGGAWILGTLLVWINRKLELIE